MKLILILTLTVIVLFVYQNKIPVSQNKIPVSQFGNGNNLDNCPIVKSHSGISLSDVINDIAIKPVGCFTNIYDTFFSSCINPYSKNNISDNGTGIRNYPEDVKTIINRVIDNGYDLYGNKILNKYRKTLYDNLEIIELATLGYLSGYKFMSITTFNSNKEIFFSYSPPKSERFTHAKPDLPFTLTPKLDNYTNELENTPGKEISCGFPCLSNGKPQTNGETVYMCGSTVYPTIKTPPRYSVYEIYEKS